MNIKHLGALIIGALCYCLPSSAQDTLLYKYNNFGQKFVQERAWLHLDNDVYYQNDTLWYAAYVQSDQTKVRPGMKSRVLYVELRSPEGIFLKQNIHPISQLGTTHGCFSLPDSLYAGYYEIRAYTAWMLNFQDQLSPEEDKEGVWQWWRRRDMPIFEEAEATYFEQKSDEERKSTSLGGVELQEMESAKTVTKRGHYYVRYEDAQLVWSIEGPAMEPLNTYEREGNTLQDKQHSFLYASNPRIFSRVFPLYNAVKGGHYEGRMMVERSHMRKEETESHPDPEELQVNFFPEGGHWVQGTKSRLVFEVTDSQGRHVALRDVAIRHKDGALTKGSNVVNRGRTYVVTDKEFWRHWSKESQLSFTLKGKSRSFPLPQPETTGVGLYAEVTGDTILAEVQPVGIAAEEIHTAILSHGQAGMRPGVNELVVFDRLGRLLTSRLFFRSLPDSLQLSTQATLQGKLAADRTVDVEIQSVPNALLSVSVQDAFESGLTFSAGNLQTYLWLTSELKGFVEEPEYYFERNDEIHRQHLDLLLLVQGWRRYDWHLQTTRLTGSGKPFNIFYRPEQGLSIQGQVIPTVRKSLKHDLELQCWITYPQHLFENNVHVTSDGMFSIQVPQVAGTWPMTLRPFKDMDDLQKEKVDFIQGRGFKYRIWKQRPIAPTAKVYSFYEATDRDAYLLSGGDANAGTVTLHEVAVTQQRHYGLDLTQPLARYNVREFLDFLNDVTYRRGYTGDSTDYEDNINNQIYTQMCRHEFMRHNNLRGKFLKEIYFEKYSKDPIGTYVDSVYWDEIFKERTFEDYNVPTNNNPMRFDQISFYSDVFGRDRFKADGQRHNISDLCIQLTSSSLANHSESQKSEFIYFHGYQPTIQRYQPTTPDEVTRTRRTLYWNPAMLTDANGKVHLKVLSNATARALQITVNGITIDNKLISSKQIEK